MITVRQLYNGNIEKAKRTLLITYKYARPMFFVFYAKADLFLIFWQNRATCFYEIVQLKKV